MSSPDPRINALERSVRTAEANLKIVKDKENRVVTEIRHTEEELKRHQAQLAALEVEEKRDEAAISTIKLQIAEIERRLEAEEKLAKLNRH